MSFDDGKLKVKKCPMCSSVHDYNIRKKTKPLAIPITPGTETDDYWVRMEVKFNCPDKDKEFTSEMSIPHRINERVLTVDTEFIKA